MKQLHVISEDFNVLAVECRERRRGLALTSFLDGWKVTHLASGCTITPRMPLGQAAAVLDALLAERFNWETFTPDTQRAYYTALHIVTAVLARFGRRAITTSGYEAAHAPRYFEAYQNAMLAAEPQHYSSGIRHRRQKGTAR